MLKLGSISISELYVGGTKIKEAYLGSLLVYASSITEILPSEAVAGDICLYDRTNDKLIIISVSDISLYSADKYSPVGVVVVPGTHDVYGDGSCGVMSLKEMNYSTPDTGSTSYQGIYWGYNLLDISSLTNYNAVCYVGSNGTINEFVQGTTENAYSPSDKFSTVKNPYDTDTGYYYNDSYKYIPSPYNDNDTRNPTYYQTSNPSSSANALADFDGKNNTNIITALATAESWKTVSSITNSYSSSYYPAACCCWRYHTDGTSQGQWYLPACGELGYIMPKFNQIQASINALISAYDDSVGVQLYSSHYYWSSSEHNNNNARGVATYHGNVTYLGKYGKYYARAFLRVGGDTSSTPSVPEPTITWSVQSGSWTEGTNESAYDGKQFTSVSPGSNNSTIIRCTFSNVISITFNCVYNGENNYDYLTVGALDTACTRTSYGTSLKGTSGTAKDITFTCDGGEHYVEFCYSKDGSVDTSPDCAVVYLKKLVVDGGGNNLISFTIGTNTYLAEKGMTWEEFVNSSYNDGYFSIDGDLVKYNGLHTIINEIGSVNKSEVIEANYNYYTGGGGSN